MNTSNEELITRIKQVKKTYNITNKMLAQDSKQCPQTIINQMCGKYKVNVETIASLIRLVPECDARWLITGEEEDTRLTELEKQVANLRDYIGSVIENFPKSTTNEG